MKRRGHRESDRKPPVKQMRIAMVERRPRLGGGQFNFFFIFYYVDSWGNKDLILLKDGGFKFHDFEWGLDTSKYQVPLSKNSY